MNTDRSARHIIWSPSGDLSFPTDSGHFREFAEKAAEHGATHVCISHLPFSRWQCVDPRDPHPEWAAWPVWSMVNPALFKVTLPPELEEWIPKEEADRNLALVGERCKILRSLGLRATFEGSEPVWLPEAVYRAHPEWRGPQVELMRIARLPYFSPCIDHPEVLALFQRAMKALCSAAPEIDSFSAMTNDSAAGVCWSNSYPGCNGPDACRHRPLAERIAGFLTAIQDGAREAGCEVAAHIWNLPRDRDVRSLLKPGQYCNHADREGQPWASGAGGANSWFSNHTHPVVGLPRVPGFAEELEGAFRATTPRVSVSFGAGVEPLLHDVYRRFHLRPTTGPASRTALLRDVAGARVGDEHAEELLTVWVQIERAVENIRHCRGIGYASLLLVGPAMMRWLTMPLVPDPTRLTPDEKIYYRRARVAKTETEADSFHALLGVPGIIGSSAVWMARNSLSEGIAQARLAADGAEKLVPDAVNGEARAELTALVVRLKALASVVLTCRNFIEYGEILTRRGRRDEEVDFREPTYGQGWINRGSYELRLVARSEVDNAYTLAHLVESAPVTVIAAASKAVEEDPFVFGPELAAQLRKKAQIMLDHWTDYNSDLYPSLPDVLPTPRPAE